MDEQTDSQQQTNSEEQSKAGLVKIRVIGDAWRQSLILPDKTPHGNKRKQQGLVANGGAYRMGELIRAVVAIVGKQDWLVTERYVHSGEQDRPVMVTGQLKECNPEADAFENLRLFGFPENEIRKNPLRMERLLGVVPFSYSDNNEEVRPTDHEYLVIYGDCLYSHLYNKGDEERDQYQNNKRKLYEEEILALFPSWEINPKRWILWHPRRFGDRSLKGNAFRSIVEKRPEIKEQTIVFLRVDGLADAGIGQRGDCSIEECLEGILDEIRYNQNGEDLLLLRGCAAVVIENGVDSAFLLKLGKGGELEECRTFFRTNRTNNAYRQNEGHIQGLGTFMVSSCLKALIDGKDEDDDVPAKLSKGIKDGLGRMLIKFNVGYMTSEEGEPTNDKVPKYLVDIYKLPTPEEILQDTPDGLQVREDKIIKIAHRYFVHERRADKTEGNAKKDSATYISRFFRIPDPLEILPLWLLERQWNEKEPRQPRDLEHSDLTTQIGFLDAIVQSGLKSLEEEGNIKFPVARFGKMEVVEPDEINMFRRLNNLMRKYFDSDDEKPLGLAVFGSPGSGKSFGIKEVAKAVIENIHWIDCNLAQFEKPEELYTKLLEAKNYGKESRKEKQLLVIFLDEFDTTCDGESLGWCKHLLSILQDGTFRLRNTVYDVGKALVVCAGGLCQSFREFEWKSREQKYRDAKIPDLISRLRGYLDVAGPNPYFPYPRTDKTIEKIGDLIKAITKPGQTPIISEDWLNRIKKTNSGGEVSSEQDQNLPIEILIALDPLYKIRRAVLLRSVLKEKMPFIYREQDNTLAIGPRVLRALLDIPKYKYGTRSMEAIIDMSVSICPDSRCFTTAMLPPPEQLEMHVDATEFYKIIESVGQRKDGKQPQELETTP